MAARPTVDAGRRQTVDHVIWSGSVTCSRLVMVIHEHLLPPRSRARHPPVVRPCLRLALNLSRHTPSAFSRVSGKSPGNRLPRRQCESSHPHDHANTSHPYKCLAPWHLEKKTPSHDICDPKGHTISFPYHADCSGRNMHQKLRFGQWRTKHREEVLWERVAQTSESAV